MRRDNLAQILFRNGPEDCLDTFLRGESLNESGNCAKSCALALRHRISNYF